MLFYVLHSLQWLHNGHDSVSKPPASRVFTQPFIQTQIKENITAPWTGEFRAQMASNAENVSILWRHH